MAIVGFVKIQEIKGESQVKAHRDEIEIHGISWSVQNTRATSGHAAGRADIGPITLFKLYDASSPYLSLAAMTGKAFADIRLSFERPSETHFDYLKIRLSDCFVTAYDMLPPDADDDAADKPISKRRASAERIVEKVALTFAQIEIVYTEQKADGSAGTEHKVQHDLALGR